ncbi:MAG: hypothetical protein KF889_18140 [Alphaproteobacteria bacterium]|nr:hypothetical protein [Alphaproteobacteria bacterium]MCW5744012.1 hypothetical protein [Alphaproteobacteria bacterium]
METSDYGYLIFVLIGFGAFIVAAAVGIVKYRAWRARRGTASTGAGRGPDGSTPPSYPRH